MERQFLPDYILGRQFPSWQFLLDNGMNQVREYAVAGLSAFVTNMRVSGDGREWAEAIDGVLNPGTRASLPKADAPYETNQTRSFLHFGPFTNKAQEESYVAFWKGWFNRNRNLLGS